MTTLKGNAAAAPNSSPMAASPNSNLAQKDHVS
jgi:hypothetical protein